MVCPSRAGESDSKEEVVLGTSLPIAAEEHASRLVVLGEEEE